jgi:hypothetical protein
VATNRKKAACLAIVVCAGVLGGLAWHFSPGLSVGIPGLPFVKPDSAAARAAPERAPDSYREIQWENMVPESWHPEKLLEGLDFSELSDDDPRVQKAFKKFTAEWAKAPVNEAMDGQRIRIPGFVAPLEWENEMELKEFLLVPYFGACIHLPPPPANQIIYVKLDEPLGGLRAMEAIWAHGTVFVERHDSGSMGAAGYRMKIDKVEPYRP